MFEGEKTDAICNKEEKKITFPNFLFALSSVLCKEELGQPLRTGTHLVLGQSQPV